MVKEKIEKCICDIAGKELNIEENVSLSVYGLDSMIKVQLVIALEEKFNIAFEEDDINQDNFQTVASIVGLLKKYNVE